MQTTETFKFVRVIGYVWFMTWLHKVGSSSVTNVTPLNIFQETWGYFLTMCGNKTFLMGIWAPVVAKTFAFTWALSQEKHWRFKREKKWNITWGNKSWLICGFAETYFANINCGDQAVHSWFKALSSSRRNVWIFISPLVSVELFLLSSAEGPRHFWWCHWMVEVLQYCWSLITITCKTQLSCLLLDFIFTVPSFQAQKQKMHIFQTAVWIN